MRVRTLCGFLLLAVFAKADVIQDVRQALAQNNFSTAQASLDSYRAKNGISSEYLEAYSWMGRAALANKQYDQASSYAKQTKELVVAQLKQRKLDADESLPIALGAAYEVLAQAMAAQG